VLRQVKNNNNNKHKNNLIYGPIYELYISYDNNSECRMGSTYRDNKP